MDKCKRSDLPRETQRTAHNNLQSNELRTVEEVDWILMNRLGLDDYQLALACSLLDRAQHSQIYSSSPLLSNFRVGACLFFGSNRISAGANYEFGAGVHRAYDEGVHAEEAALANAFDTFGTQARIIACAVVSDAAHASTPCGKCRSVLQTYAREDVVIVSAGKDRVCRMWKLSELLPSDFPVCDLSTIPENDRRTLDALLAERDASYHEPRVGFATRVLGTSLCVIAAGSRLYSTPRVDSLAFYSTSSLRATIASALKDNPPQIDAVLVRSRLPVLTGEDRQLLFEFAAQSNQTTTLPVYWQLEGSDTLWRATPASLLPDAFGPGDLSA